RAASHVFSNTMAIAPTSTTRYQDVFPIAPEKADAQMPLQVAPYSAELTNGTGAGASNSFSPGRSSKIVGRLSFMRFSRRSSAVPRTPKPYFTLRWKLIDEASSKYFVGHEISPTRNPK